MIERMITCDGGVKLKIVRRLLAPLIIGSASVVAYLYINLTDLNSSTIGMNEFYGEQFFSVMATLYAIITALILVKGIESFDALSSAISHEAMKIRSINAYCSYYSQEAQKSGGSIHGIRKLLIEYADNVLMQRSAVKSTKNDDIIDSCIYHCSQIDIADDNDRIALQEIMKGLDEFRTLRANRINCARNKIPHYLIWMLVLMTVSIITPFFLEQQKAVHFNHYIIFTLSTFASFIYFLLQDINRPYDGLWTIDLSPFSDAKEEVRKKI